MELQGKSKFDLKQFMKMWIFLIGVGVLAWQSKSTFATTTLDPTKLEEQNNSPVSSAKKLTVELTTSSPNMVTFVVRISKKNYKTATCIFKFKIGINQNSMIL